MRSDRCLLICLFSSIGCAPTTKTQDVHHPVDEEPLVLSADANGKDTASSGASSGSSGSLSLAGLHLGDSPKSARASDYFPPPGKVGNTPGVKWMNAELKVDGAKADNVYLGYKTNRLVYVDFVLETEATCDRAARTFQSSFGHPSTDIETHMMDHSRLKKWRSGHGVLNYTAMGGPNHSGPTQCFVSLRDTNVVAEADMLGPDPGQPSQPSSGSGFTTTGMGNGDSSETTSPGRYHIVQ